MTAQRKYSTIRRSLLTTRKKKRELVKTKKRLDRRRAGMIYKREEGSKHGNGKNRVNHNSWPSLDNTSTLISETQKAKW